MPIKFSIILIALILLARPSYSSSQGTVDIPGIGKFEYPNYPKPLAADAVTPAEKGSGAYPMLDSEICKLDKEKRIVTIEQAQHHEMPCDVLVSSMYGTTGLLTPIPKYAVMLLLTDTFPGQMAVVRRSEAMNRAPLCDQGTFKGCWVRDHLDNMAECMASWDCVDGAGKSVGKPRFNGDLISWFVPMENKCKPEIRFWLNSTTDPASGKLFYMDNKGGYFSCP